MDDSLVAAHSHSLRHHGEVMASTKCGCFYCCQTFAPSEIKDWIADGAAESDKTALCPHCGIDSVIGSASGYPIDKEFLERMKIYWF